MRALTATEVLMVWEKTRGQTPLRQALEWLACAVPERSLEDWAAQPVGRVCLALFRLRSMMFGPAMPGVAACPRCSERLEFVFQCRDAMGGLAPELSAGPLFFHAGERKIDMRLPTPADLLAARSTAELLARCVDTLEEDISQWFEAASAVVAEADPLAETLLDLTCPSCQHTWQAVLDIAAYLSQEIAHQARKLLSEVHRLASAYGWNEPEILALSAARRRAYLELAGA